MNSDSVVAPMEAYPASMTHHSMTTVDLDGTNKRSRDELEEGKDLDVDDDASFVHPTCRPSSAVNFDLSSTSCHGESVAIGASSSSQSASAFAAPVSLLCSGGIRPRNVTTPQPLSLSQPSQPLQPSQLPARAAPSTPRATSTGSQVPLPMTDVSILTTLQAMTCGGQACVGCSAESAGHPFLPIDDLIQPTNRRCNHQDHDGATLSSASAPADHWKATPFRHLCSSMLRAFSDRNGLAVALSSEMALEQWQSSVDYLKRLLHKALVEGFLNSLPMLNSYLYKRVPNSDGLLENASAAMALFGCALSYHNAFFNGVAEIVAENEEHRALQLHTLNTSVISTPHIIPFSMRIVIRAYRTMFYDMFPTAHVLTDLLEKAFRQSFEMANIQTRNCFWYSEHDRDLMERILGPADRLR